MKKLLLILTFAFGFQANANMCKKFLSKAFHQDVRPTELLSAPHNQKVISVLKKITSKNKPLTDEVHSWINDLQTTVKTKPLSVIEHSALAYLYNTKFLERHGLDSKILSELLITSWVQITKKPFPKSGQLYRLPRMALKQAPPEARYFNKAAFHSKNLKPLRPPINKNNLTLERMGQLYHRVPGGVIKSLTLLTTTVAALSHLASAEVLYGFYSAVAGTVVGHIGASWNEYNIHIGMGHDDPKLKGVNRILRKLKFGKIAEYTEEVTVAHQAHHIIINQDYGANLDNNNLEEKVKKYLRAHVGKLVKSRDRTKNLRGQDFENEVSRIITYLKSGGYGLDAVPAGIAGLHITAIPFITANFIISALMYQQGLEIPSAIFALTSFISLSASITISTYSHPTLHTRVEDISHRKDSQLLKYYMATPMGWKQQMRHYVHHHADMDVDKTVNGAIMAFSLADYIVLGLRKIKSKEKIKFDASLFKQLFSNMKISEPTIEDLIKMYDEGFLNFNYYEQL